MTFADRAQILAGMSSALRAGRDELFELSRRNNGTTLGDASFDIDGASGALYYYSKLGQSLGARKLLPDGSGVQLAKTEGFWAQHVLAPRSGVAVHINAFNFPVWGFAEKAACALLAGMPVITKPATATALVAERAVEMILEAGILPDGAFQMICGATGDLLDLLGPQDVLAFTGSADTAARLRDRSNFLATNTHINVEADSLNAAVMGADVEKGPLLDLFVRDVVREMTQKAGQKCTAVRRILVPRPMLEATEEALSARLARTTVGDPADESVRMGPLASERQLADARAGVEALGGERVFPADNPELPDSGFFFPPTLLRQEAGTAAGIVHELEVFGPVASVVPYDGSAQEAARVVALGGGTLVTSVYSNDPHWLADFLPAVAASTGRVYVGSDGSAEAAPGSGAAFPQSLHGGPGRAGGGQELGGRVGLELYMQRVALQGERQLVENLAGLDDSEG
jgi:oxepin-CoA hydrolase/3-oxo-5,6-dehydrosuberyl-CoA semialdehyde dehydrogenase